MSGSRFGSSLRSVSIRVFRLRSRVMGVRCSRIEGGRRRSESLISLRLSDLRKVGLSYHLLNDPQAVSHSSTDGTAVPSFDIRKVGLWSGMVVPQSREGGTTVPPSPSETRRNQFFYAGAFGVHPQEAL